MTTRLQHEEQAERNLRLHEQLLQQGAYLEWAVTVLFYAALHWINACLKPKDPRTHKQRNSLIRKQRQLQEVWGSYRLLQERSRDARYECSRPSREKVRNYRSQYFDPLHDHVEALLQSERHE